MHFWIDKRSQACGFGRSRVAASLSGSGMGFGVHHPRRTHRKAASSSNRFQNTDPRQTPVSSAPISTTNTHHTSRPVHSSNHNQPQQHHSIHHQHVQPQVHHHHHHNHSQNYTPQVYHQSHQSHHSNPHIHHHPHQQSSQPHYQSQPNQQQQSCAVTVSVPMGIVYEYVE